MNILLDTHILLWTLTGSHNLSQQARKMISDSDNIIYYSIASVWEVEIKHSIGKISISGEEFAAYCKQAGFKLLEIKEAHIFHLNTLKRDQKAPKHNDPFDKILLAQAKTEDFKIITHDTLISQYREPCVILV